VVLRALVGVIAVLGAYLFFWPVPIQPHRWRPAPDPGQTGPYVANDDLGRASLLTVGDRPEDVAPETAALGPRDGRIYTGLANGWIVRFDPKGGRAQRFADVGPRPLGLVFDPDGTLYLAHTTRGILSITPDGRIAPVADCIDGAQRRFTDSLVLAGDGAIWFTCPSRRFDLDHVRLDAMETQPTGRLMRHDRATGRTTVELDGLMFANGVAMGPDDAFVLVNEWAGYRITRLWLTGPKRGRHQPFIDNLPGYPDNIHRDATGLYWVGLVVRRNPLLDRLHPHPFLMRIIPRIPESLQPHAPRFGWLLALDERGRVVHNFQDATNVTDQVTGALRLDGQLFVTSNTMPAIARLPAPVGDAS
jgi:sugar lactone lactonase YvrE